MSVWLHGTLCAPSWYFLSTFCIFRTEQTYRKHGANLPKQLSAEPDAVNADVDLELDEMKPRQHPGRSAYQDGPRDTQETGSLGNQTREQRLVTAAISRDFDQVNAWAPDRHQGSYQAFEGTGHEDFQEQSGGQKVMECCRERGPGLTSPTHSQRVSRVLLISLMTISQTVIVNDLILRLLECKSTFNGPGYLCFRGNPLGKSNFPGSMKFTLQAGR